MARSETVTMIPLDRAARILGIDPYHFNTIVTLRRPENTACDDIWFNYAWQRVGQASRDDLAKALYQAERETARYLNYYPMPVWTDSEEERVEKPFAVELRNYRGNNSRNQWKSIRTDFGHVIETGRKAKSLISAEVAVSYSDEDVDGYCETATASFETTVTDEQEIRLYFTGKSGKDAWEIRPIEVTIGADGIATATFPRYLVPNPELWERDPDDSDPVWRVIDGDETDNFIEAVDAYRVYTDTTVQATFYHEGTCYSCNGSGCSACGYTTQTACLRVRDSRLGLLSYTPATWNATTEQFDYAETCYPDPEKIVFHYRSGLVNNELDYPYRQMDPEWERVIVYYAMTLLERADNVCGNFQNVYERYSEDLALNENGRSFTLAFKNLQNPLGTTRAAINLWRKIERDRLI